MADRPSRVNLQPTEEDWELIDESIEFHGGDYPDALRRGLRAGKREIQLLKAARGTSLSVPLAAKQPSVQELAKALTLPKAGQLSEMERIASAKPEKRRRRKI